MSESSSRAVHPARGARDQIFEDSPNLTEILSRAEGHLKSSDPKPLLHGSHSALRRRADGGRPFKKLRNQEASPFP